MRTDDDFLLLTEELPAPLRLRTSRRRLLSGEVERWHPPHQVSDVQLTHPPVHDGNCMTSMAAGGHTTAAHRRIALVTRTTAP